MSVSRQYISETLDKIPRYELLNMPTPLDKAENLREALKQKIGQCPRLFIKREDLSGLTGGGVESRQFEFIIGYTLEEKCDTVVVACDYYSNLASIAAAACARVGHRCIVISADKLSLPITGNLLSARIMGAEIYRVSKDYVSASLHRILEKVRAEGGKPYVIEEGKFADCNGAIAFFRAGLEIESQILEEGIDEGVTICGLTDQSIGGLGLYAKARGINWKLLAASHNPTLNDYMEDVMISASNSAAKILGLDISLNAEDIELAKDFAYNSDKDVISSAVLEAIHTVAGTESIILDPNYSGRGIAALIAEIKRGRFTEHETVIFIHPGGMQQVFAFDREIWRWREGCPPIVGEIRGGQALS